MRRATKGSDDEAQRTHLLGDRTALAAAVALATLAACGATEATHTAPVESAVPMATSGVRASSVPATAAEDSTVAAPTTAIGSARAREFRERLLAVQERHLDTVMYQIDENPRYGDLRRLHTRATELIVGRVGQRPWIEEVVSELPHTPGAARHFWLRVPLVATDGSERHVVFFLESSGPTDANLEAMHAEYEMLAESLEVGTPTLAFLYPFVGDPLTYDKDTLGGTFLSGGDGFVIADENGAPVSLAIMFRPTDDEPYAGYESFDALVADALAMK